MEFKNNARSTVADNPLAAGATTLNVAPGEGGNFPSSFPFLTTIWDSSPYPGDDSEMEIVKCTGRTTDALTIIRAQEGTADVAHSNGEKVAMLLTAGHFNDPSDGIITKLDTIEANADVTDATNVDAAGAVMESDIPNQSFTNLLQNGDFESWSSGVNIVPDGWTKYGNGSVVREGTEKKIHSYSTKLTVGASGITRIHITASAAEINYLKGRTVTLGCWVKSANTVADKISISIYGNTGGSSSSYYSNSGGWEWINVTHTFHSSDSSILLAQVIIDFGADAVAYFDGAIIVEGSVCPAFSPKPLSDDGKTIQIDSNNNKITSMKQVYEPSSDTLITAAGGITVTNTIMRVAGDSGAIDITANPQIVAGTDGQIVIIQGTHDTNTVTLDDGTGLALSAQMILSAQDNITLMYDSGDSEWIEISRTTVV